LVAGKADMIVRQLDSCGWKTGGLTATKKTYRLQRRL
jgi:hypothetical protein